MPQITLDPNRARKVQSLDPAKIQRVAEQQPQPQPSTPSGSESDIIRQLTVGASPLERRDRLIGAGQTAGKIGLGTMQWFQNALGMDVTPTPVWLEPKNPTQRLGQTITKLAASLAPAAITAGASLPIATAGSAVTGGLQSDDPQTAMMAAIVGGIVPSVSGAMKELIARFPSKARAGAKFQTVMGQAANEPLDTSAADAVAARASELKSRGSSLPKVLNDYLKNRRAATDPMTYRVGRDFASNAGAVSAREATRMNAPMQAQVVKFSQAMKTANREAAARAGVGDLYDEAMREYAKAANLAEKTEIVKKWVQKNGPPIVVGGVAAKLYYDLTH